MSHVVLSLAITARPTSSNQPVQFTKLNKLGDSDCIVSMVEKRLTGNEIGQGRFAMTNVPQVTGKARLAYDSLLLTDYQTYKRCRKLYFQISAGAYHDRFRAAQLGDSNSESWFHAAMISSPNRWIELGPGT